MPTSKEIVLALVIEKTTRQLSRGQRQAVGLSIVVFPAQPFNQVQAVYPSISLEEFSKMDVDAVMRHSPRTR